MEFVAHRINTIKKLSTIPPSVGVELDLRDDGNKLILCHDPFTTGQPFESYISCYEHSLMILNIKSERIEHRALELLKKYNITNYFFLDSSFPMIYLLSKQGERNIAIRYSEFESLDTVLAMQGKAQWVWVDCFTTFPLDHTLYNILKKAGFKLCLVSPELQGRNHDIENYARIIKNEKIIFDAICTKLYNIDRWKTLLNQNQGENYENNTCGSFTSNNNLQRPGG